MSNTRPNSNKPKGKKPYRERKPSRNEHFTKDCINDPKWYEINPQTTADVASLAYSNVLGQPMYLFNDASSYIPGIAKISVEMSLGMAGSASDAPTVASRKEYSFIRHANSGSANYEAPDLTMYLVCHAALRTYLAELARVYGLLQLYSVKSRYWGERLVSSMGYNYSNLLANMPQLRALINVSGAKLAALAAPKQFFAADRWAWMTSNVFLDDESSKPQIYYYSFERYPLLTVDSAEGTSITFIDKPGASLDGMPTAAANIDTITAFIDRLLSPLFNDEDFGIMSGDILKAYKSEVVKFNPINVDYICVPVVNHEPLSQIHNIHAPYIGRFDSYSHSISQFAGSITETCSFSMVTTGGIPRSFYSSLKPVLDMYKDDPSPDDTMVATRLIPLLEVGVDANEVSIQRCGSDFVIAINAFDTYIVTSIVQTGKRRIDDGVSAAFSKSERIATNFDWFPKRYLLNYAETSVEVCGDIENYTVLDRNVLGAMHDAAILALMLPSDRFGQMS